MDPILSHITIAIHYASRSHLTRQWNAQKTLCPEAKLYCPTTGSGFVTYGGVTRTLLPGSLFLIPPGVMLDYGLDSQMDILWAHVDARVMGAVGLFDYAPMAFLVRDRDGACRTAMERLVWLCHAGGGGDQLEAQGIVLQLLAQFMRAEEDGAAAARRGLLRRFEPVFRHIDAHPGTALSVGTLAAVAKLETSHFASLFSRAVGMPPARYVTRRRIEHAQALLRTTEATVGEVAAELGFADAFHFSRVFKRVTAMSPRAFRDSAGKDFLP